MKRIILSRKTGPKYESKQDIIRSIPLDRYEQIFLDDLKGNIGKLINEISFEEFVNGSNGFISYKGNIVYLRLRNAKIQQLPLSIGNLKKLRFLDLSGNFLKNFPVSFKNLKRLKALNISGNKYSNTLVKYSNDLPKLKKIWFFDSRLNNEIDSRENSFQDINSLLKSKSQSYIENHSSFNKNATNNNDVFIKIRDMLRNSNPIEIHKIDKSSKRLFQCNVCNNQEFETILILLDLVRKSPRKLVFVIRLVVVKCTKCNQKQEYSYDNCFNLKNSLNFNKILKNELYLHIVHNYYCSKCNDFYKNLEICPVHKIKMIIPPLVFIRGINQQFLSKSLFNDIKQE